MMTSSTSASSSASGVTSLTIEFMYCAHSGQNPAHQQGPFHDEYGDHLQCRMNTTMVVPRRTRSPNLTLSPCSSISSIRLASYSARIVGGVSTSNAAFSAFFLSFFSFRPSRFFGA